MPKRNLEFLKNSSMSQLFHVASFSTHRSSAQHLPPTPTPNPPCYLATLLRAGSNATPYSMVTPPGAVTPADLRDDEIVVSQWLAEDLQVKPGDAIGLSYFLPSPARS